MKRKILLPLLIASLWNLSSQQIVEITFTAAFDSIHCPLDSVYIQNLTSGGDTTLYGSDTVLLLFDYTGIHVHNPGYPAGLTLFPCYPNPSSGVTNMRFYLAGTETVTIRAYDIAGREHIRHSQLLPDGYHSFIFTPGQEQFWLISVETASQRKVQKLINTGGSTAVCRLEYAGTHLPHINTFRTTAPPLPWTPGDLLRFYGFAKEPGKFTALHQIVDEIPLLSGTIPFNLIEGMPCMGVPFVYDIDNNRYRTVRIGNRCWMREDLKTRKYNNGEVIPEIFMIQDWISLQSGAMCWYDNNQNNYSSAFGALYNGYAISLDKLCPPGWHVPSSDEFVALGAFLGGDSIAGNKLKERGLDHWMMFNDFATNDVGFTALPGGKRLNYELSYPPGHQGFEDMYYNGYWWTSTDIYSYHGSGRKINYLSEKVHWILSLQNYGHYVRCIMNDTASGQSAPMSDFTATPNPVIIHDTIQFADATLYNPQWWKWYFGDGDSSSLQNPSHAYSVKGFYTVTLITGNQWGTDTLVRPAFLEVTGPGVNWPVVDFDGNIYDTVFVNNQIWLKQNLRTTSYNDGGPIIEIAASHIWSATQVGARCWYDNDSASYASVYGSLYNWYAVETGKLCPQGFRVPTLAEWNDLVNHLGGDAVAGGKLKEAGASSWTPPNTGATNEIGFTALPGGQRSGDPGASFSGMGTNGYWWSSSNFGTTNTWNAGMSNTSTQVNWGFSGKREGLSVRCILD